MRARAALERVDAGEARTHAAAVERALGLVEAWELNGRGLVYVPPGGFWADEYPLGGYVLTVQLLRLWTLRALGRDADALAALLERELRLEPGRAGIWHPTAHRRAREAGFTGWAASLHPGGYEVVFDGLAHALVALLGLEGADEAAEGLARRAGELGLVPAYDPPVTPGMPGWEELRSYHRYAFRNEPGYYHNGGRWPFVTAFAALGLAARGRPKAAAVLADGIDRLNAAEGWSFPEYAHGVTGAPGGARRVAWSAAASLLAHHASLSGTAGLPGM